MVQGKLARIDLFPAPRVVDGGDVRAPKLVSSRANQHIDLIGPFHEDRQRQAKADAARGRTMAGMHFAAADYLACPSRLKCTHAKVGYRGLLLRPRDEYEALQFARKRQETVEFTADDAHRAGIGGTFSQGVRAFGLRRARYRGLSRTHLQHVATAAAINVGRLTNWLNGMIPIGTRRSRLAVLAPES